MIFTMIAIRAASALVKGVAGPLKKRAAAKEAASHERLADLDLALTPEEVDRLLEDPEVEEILARAQERRDALKYGRGRRSR